MVDESSYECFDIDGPKFLIMTYCGAFLGGYKIIGEKPFKLLYNIEDKPICRKVAYHSMLTLLPTIDGEVTVDPNDIRCIHPIPVDGLTMTGEKMLTLKQYIASHCSSSTLEDMLVKKKLLAEHFSREELFDEKKPTNHTLTPNVDDKKEFFKNILDGIVGESSAWQFFRKASVVMLECSDVLEQKNFAARLEASDAMQVTLTRRSDTKVPVIKLEAFHMHNAFLLILRSEAFFVFKEKNALLFYVPSHWMNFT